jgi:EAL domain-containing protein (putative c-di-GMP-specific phosphodiesterase class I)
MEAGGQTITLSLSVGLSIWPLHGTSFDDLLRQCDSALYEAQAAGGNRFTVFSEKAHAARSDRFQKISDLRQALDHKQLEMFFQPMHDAGTGEVTGMEALIRWHHPELGLIYPAEFVPLAEETELILDLGYWVLEATIDQMVWLRENNMGNLAIAMNVSPRQFADRAFARHIQDCVDQSGVDPQMLHLEITEDSLVEDFEQTRESLDMLRSLGAKIYVDDFGVGYSSLNYVRSLPVDGLKIDKSFVDNIGRSSQDEAVVATIVKLARSLDLDIVAEGIENSYQRDFLLQLGCRCLQGYLYSEPIARPLLLDYLDNDRGAAVAG